MFGHGLLIVSTICAILKGPHSLDLDVLSGALSWLVDLSKWLVELWNNNVWLFPPSVPVQISRKRPSYIHHRRSCNKVPQLAEDWLFFLVFFFFWKILSNKTRISVKIT